MALSLTTGNDGTPLNLGLKFQTTQDGLVLGVRFYKPTGDTGTHTGSLWSSSGQKLGDVTFTGETASGWQQALFSSPIAIQANQTYVVSYFSPSGNYIATNGYFSGLSLTRGVLIAPSSESSGGNGVFDYGNQVQMPTSSYQGSNYYVDVLFQGSGVAPALQPPSGFTYANASIVATQGVAISPISPTISGGAVASYSASTLPAGLSLNTTTGVISGTPTTAMVATPYAITATNAAGSVSTNIIVTVNASTPVPPPSGGMVDLIVIQGESNAAGNAPNTGAPAAELGVRNSVQIYNHVTGKFETLNIGANNQQDSFIDLTHHGLELALANERDAGNLPNPIYLVKIGVSGSYVEEWLPNNTSGFQLWDENMPFVDGAIAQLKAMGKSYRITVWQSLGLNDRFNQGTSMTTFVNKMATIRTNFRNRVGDQTVRFLSTDFNNPPASTFDWDSLWTTTMPAMDPFFIPISVIGTTYMDGGSHFDYAGFKVIARNMVTAMVGSSMPAPAPSPVPMPSGSTSLSFTQIPVSNPDLIAPGRGAEHWGGALWTNDNNGVPQVPTGNSEGLNVYDRLSWVDLETVNQGVYNWARFDNAINNAIDKGKRYSFSIMNLFTAYAWMTVNGAALSYPLYLHNQMQSDPVAANRDWITGGAWVPNWNSEFYLTAWENMMKAMAAHIAAGSHNGRAYKDVIYYVDIRGYGDFGEWHTYPWTNSTPTAVRATAATLKRIIDATVNAFPNFPLVNLIGAFNLGGELGSDTAAADVSYYALTRSNNYGRFGWRRDNWGDDGYNTILDNNDQSFNGVALNTLIMSAWKSGPIVGEPLNTLDTVSRTGNATGQYVSCGSAYCDLERQIRLYHATSFGNGNYPVTGADVNFRNNILASSKASGYRLVLNGGSFTPNLASDRKLSVQLNWRNIGIAPAYESWNTMFELRNSSGATVWSGQSTMALKLFLPDTVDRVAQDSFVLPTTVGSGSYSLVLVVRDPSGYRQPLPLAINGRAADGSYSIGSVKVP